jgi:hypothetical protein
LLFHLLCRGLLLYPTSLEIFDTVANKVVGFGIMKKETNPNVQGTASNNGEQPENPLLQSATITMATITAIDTPTENTTSSSSLGGVPRDSSSSTAAAAASSAAADSVSTLVSNYDAANPTDTVGTSTATNSGSGCDSVGSNGLVVAVASSRRSHSSSQHSTDVISWSHGPEEPPSEPASTRPHHDSPAANRGSHPGNETTATTTNHSPPPPPSMLLPNGQLVDAKNTLHSHDVSAAAATAAYYSALVPSRLPDAVSHETVDHDGTDHSYLEFAAAAASSTLSRFDALSNQHWGPMVLPRHEEDRPVRTIPSASASIDTDFYKLSMQDHDVADAAPPQPRLPSSTVDTSTTSTSQTFSTSVPDRANDDDSKMEVAPVLNPPELERHDENARFVPVDQVLYDGEGRHVHAQLPMLLVEAMATTDAAVPTVDTERGAIVPNNVSREASNEQNDSIAPALCSRIWQPRFLRFRLVLLFLSIAIVAAVLLALVGQWGRYRARTDTRDEPIRENSTPPPAPPEPPLLPTDAPSYEFSQSTLSNQVLDYINTVTMTGPLLNGPGDPLDPTPEEVALLRLFANNPLLDLFPNTTRNQFRWRQRYALATALAPNNFENKEDECQWSGVYCDSTVLSDIGEIEVVRALYLGNSNIQFALSPDLALLSTLFSFRSENALIGSIPYSLGNWTLLKRFIVANNDMTGSLPDSIVRWTNLEILDLNDNSFVGQLPKTIGQWTQLKHFGIHENAFTGSLPDSVSNWTSLENLILWSNSMKGTFSDSIGRWTNLLSFDVGNNNFDGTLPSSIQQWTSLTMFAVEEIAGLKGPLPNFAKWPNLFAIEANACAFTGTTPEFLPPHMDRFDVSSNSLSGTLPTSIGQWTNVKIFNVFANNFTGPLPDVVGQWSNIEEFNAAHNSFTGTVPGSIANWTRLREGYFYQNNFVGSLPQGICSVQNLTSLRVDCTHTCGCCDSYCYER